MNHDTALSGSVERQIEIKSLKMRSGRVGTNVNYSVIGAEGTRHKGSWIETGDRGQGHSHTESPECTRFHTLCRQTRAAKSNDLSLRKKNSDENVVNSNAPYLGPFLSQDSANKELII